ncbi:hypothetical protein [Janibacter terrae]|uniref:hypothetical protein n=1 Tax=Janibacter terrae TaxID=103817 RepID=UPI0031FA0907
MSAATETRPVTPEEFTARAVEHDQKRATLLQDLSVLEEQAGAMMLDDPDAAETLTERVASLRARADLEGRAAVEARSRAREARVAGLREEADAFEPKVARIRKELAEYQDKRDKLLKELEEFTRAEWIVKPDPDALLVGPYTRPARPDEMLLRELQQIEEQQTALRSQADAVAADPNWEPAEIRRMRQLRADWERKLAGYREELSQLKEWRKDLELRQAQGLPTEEVAEFVRDTETEIWRLYGDVKSFRDGGLEFSAEELQALRVEFGLDLGAGGE